MAGSGHTQIKFDGILTWNELKKHINVAGRGIPDTATVLLSSNGSADPELREQQIIVDWDLDEAVEQSVSRRK